MSKLWIFRAGNTVPQFVYKYPTEYVRGEFLVDVIIMQHKNSIDIFPINSLVEGSKIIYFKSFTDENVKIVIKGAPTTLFSKPCSYIGIE